MGILAGLTAIVTGSLTSLLGSFGVGLPSTFGLPDLISFINAGPFGPENSRCSVRRIAAATLVRARPGPRITSERRKKP